MFQAKFHIQAKFLNFQCFNKTPVMYECINLHQNEINKKKVQGFLLHFSLNSINIRLTKIVISKSIKHVFIQQ